MEWIERVGCKAMVAAPLVAAVVASVLTAALMTAPNGPTVRADRVEAPTTTAGAMAVGPVRAAVASGMAADVVALSGAAAEAVAGGVSGPVGADALTAVGQLLADDHACTAAVVASSSGRLAITAAHCVYVPAPTERMPDVADGRKRGWVDEAVFVPARSGDDAPHGVWAVERMWVDRAWQDHATPEVDVAFLQLRDAPTGTASAGTAQEILGSLGMRFDTDGAAGGGDSASGPGTGSDATDGESAGGEGPTVDVLGYPTAAPFDGTRLRRCDQVSTDPGWAGLLEARCALTPGASGGPWVIPGRGWWSVTAVTSYLSWDRPGALGGARLGVLAERLWRTADQAAQR